MFNDNAICAIERDLTRNGDLHRLQGKTLRDSLAACLDSAWQKNEAAKPGSWPEDLPPVIITAGPRLGFFLEECLYVAGMTQKQVRAIEINVPFSIRAWPHLIEATHGNQPTQTIYTNSA